MSTKPSDRVDFQQVFRNAPDAYLVLAPDAPQFTIQAASDAYLTMTGSTREQLLGRPLFEAFPDDPMAGPTSGSAELRELLEEVLETGKTCSIGTFRYDIPVDTPNEDGSNFVERYWSPRYIPVFGEDGALLHILHRADDVTDFILRERARRQSVDDPMVAHERPADKRLLLVDSDRQRRRVLEQLFAYHWDVKGVGDGREALGHAEDFAPDVVFIHESPPDLSATELTGRLKAGQACPPPRVVLRIEAPPASLYEQAFRAGADDVISGPLAPREVLARVQAQLWGAELQEVLDERSRQQYRRLLMDAPIAMALVEGPDLVFTMSNPAHDELTGHRDLIGQPVREAFPDPKLQRIFDALEEVYVTGEPAVFKERPVEFQPDDGPAQTRYVTFAYLPFHDLQGDIQGVATFAYEVTELVEMRRAAERESERKDEFLAMLGHELRNPLTPIAHAAEMLDAPPESIDAQTLEWAADTLARQTRQMSHLVDDLLDLSRINQGRIQIRTAPCDLAEIIEAAIDGPRSQIEQRNQHLDVDLPTPPPTVEVDRERLVQVVSNLLDNASKYTPPGGHIALQATTNGTTLEIEVRDDGRGIEAELLSEIFGQFTRTEYTRGREDGGLGLGLALVKQIVDLHGGTVEAFSDGPERGSRFVVRLPSVVLQPGETPTDAQVPTEEAPEQVSDPRVLIADDNPDVLSSLARLLETTGADIRTASSGLEALETLEDFRPQLIILDIGLPEMDGFEVARRIRESPLDRDPTLVALSGYGRPGDIERAREAGFDRHLAKPADTETLFGLIESIPPDRPAPEG